MDSTHDDSFAKRLCDEASSAMQPYNEKNLPRVVTYQLPVPCGDCSVHLLVNGKGKTVSAFIMDGDRDAQGLEASRVVHVGLRLIARIHGIGRPYLRAWVVTHWDRDHFEGVLNLIEAEKMNQFVLEKDFWLYCATDKKIVTRVSTAFEKCSIKTTRVVGAEAIGCNFFGQEMNHGPVGFWCVGGDGYSYDKGFKIPPEPQKEGDLLKNLKLVSVKENSPTPNERSLMAVIMWRGSGKSQRRFSYFCAGDGNFTLEKDVVCPQVFQGQPVKAFKLDHHGSSGEFSCGEVLEGLGLPQRLIVTPGHQYGHPCWDVLFQISRMYKQGKRDKVDKLLYTTRLPYWVDESKFGKWLTTDLNINPNSTKVQILLGAGSTSNGKKKLLTGSESQKAVDKALAEAREQKLDFKQFMKTIYLEAEDEDEEDDPNFTYEDGFADLLATWANNQGTVYESVVDIVTQELKVATNGKYKMKDEAEEEKIVKFEDESTEYKYDVVKACVDMWNSISDQKILDEVVQSRYYLLQLISANDDELDGVVAAHGWPEIPESKSLSHL
ncbi:uncharacterized protein FMAN_12232 [Fusarium mangiferae]|uniref:Metallo-beta-lactamase domain-containing protein n=1 Tax=Fusarium mangiferae TaxID=192010 RepID=A0A1L7THI6_FUSMA|nr:uncharacterized protein FMAN_12232 [Fusarium mangiferae]CVK98150.1 uncharacterized protein FMAN_12232 [Fusarium mangiferae]